MKFFLLMNTKMPTIVAIFLSVSRDDFMLSLVEHEKKFYNLDTKLFPHVILENWIEHPSACNTLLFAACLA